MAVPPRPARLRWCPSGAGTGGVAVQPTPAIAGAGGLTVRLGGYFAFTGALIQDDWDRGRSRNTANGVNNAQARQRDDFRNDMELNVFIDGRASQRHDLRCGVRIPDGQRRRDGG